MSEEGAMRVVLVGAGEARHLAELGRLAGTLGLEVEGVLEQVRRDGTGYLGRGKREELGGLVEEVGATMVVADDELTASQARVLERAAGVAVVDRTELIIRIFESHARDAASRLQVELAELEYRLPRVKGRSPELSRLGGGGAITRGPGEQQLEYDRRAIRERMETINRRLKEEETARSVRGARMRKGGPPTVALVGYTNAGKTTILNALSGASRSTKDRLFETLETTTRLVEGGSTANNNNGHDGTRPDFVVTDTVGFIRKLPTQLVHSFASTLEAARDADVRVLCADASSEELEEEIQTVGRTLFEVVGTDLAGAGDEAQGAATTILCLNKMDLLSEERVKELRKEYPGAVIMSALEGCEELLEPIYRAIASERERVEILIPHAEYAAASRLYGTAEIHAQESTSSGLWMDVSLPRSASAKYASYKVAKEQ
jgi:GTPase